MSHPSVRNQVIGLVLWLALAFCVGALGAVASIEAVPFYLQLVRPTWGPPAGVFGPVWSVLYVLMATAAWLVWRERGEPLSVPGLALFVAQLVFNGLWSWLFFAWHRGALAFADVIVLAVLIAVTVAVFWRIRRLAAVLLMPYLAWVSFAGALTWSVWRNNPGVL
jgi:translocator protein